MGDVTFNEVATTYVASWLGMDSYIASLVLPKHSISEYI